MRILLVSMPFMAVHRPSIQLGLLKATAEKHGFEAGTRHANLDFAKRVGDEYYDLLAEHRGRLVGDWLFSVEAFGEQAPDPDGRFIDAFADDLAYLGDSSAAIRERLSRTRTEDVPAFLDALTDEILAEDVRLVGFSSTFQQNAASFALARRLKRGRPAVTTVFGGANFDGEMGPELVRSVDCVDFAVVGEADSAFPGLLRALADGSDPGSVPGVVRRVGGSVVETPPAPPTDDLDSHPDPDYDEYFARSVRLGRLPPSGPHPVCIPFESSRGCWWGERHHCTFCGLNGTTMAYRAKSPGRVARELVRQARRYRCFRFEAVDNILAPRYLDTLVPDIARSHAGYEIFYEIKANLRRDQMKRLAEAGIREIQPGLESLSSRVLTLMRKGTTAAQNVNVLRWGRYYGIEVRWNVLWGFPGETAEDYASQARLVPHLVHLAPPCSAGRIWLERFSPLFAESRSRTPEASYRYVYPEEVDLAKAAYFFEYDLDGALPDDTYAGLKTEIDAWQDRWRTGEPPTLTYRWTPGLLHIYDGRHPDREGAYEFTDAVADVYALCADRPRTARAVREQLGMRVTVEYVEEVFREFDRLGLIFLDKAAALALAVPAVGGR